MTEADQFHRGHDLPSAPLSESVSADMEFFGFFDPRCFSGVTLENGPTLADYVRALGQRPIGLRRPKQPDGPTAKRAKVKAARKAAQVTRRMG